MNTATRIAKRAGVFALVAMLGLMLSAQTALAACTAIGSSTTVSAGQACDAGGGAAGTCQSDGTTCTANSSGSTSTDKKDTTAPSSATTIKPRDLPNPLAVGNENPDLFTLLGRATTIFTSISGSIALLMFVYGGILWIASGGNSERVEAGRKAIMYSVIGLVIIFGSYAILRAIFIALGAQL